MLIQYASDLHLEFAQNKQFLKSNPLQALGEVLLLAGDIVPFGQIDKHEDFFSYLADHFETTYWIPGNHEYYHYDAATKTGVLNEKVKNNVFLVNNIAISQGNVNFIFSTLWSAISPAYEWEIERGMNDFHVIKYNGFRFSVPKFNQLHEECLVFIKQELQQNKASKTVVVTHHVPTLMHYPEQYKTSTLNQAFAVELFDMIDQAAIDVWVYGHHHKNTPDFKIGNTQMLTNQLGYVQQGEHFSFDTGKTIEW
ncbi:MAG: metallophosphoesterase [Bacteroidota bacterium]